jgi:benzoyl-CoA-dihydrodiol lyase
MDSAPQQQPPVEFETDPSRYRHWQVSYEGPIARLKMCVDPAGGLRPGYELKLNSYDLGVDIELADVVRRMRFEHPEVRVVVLSSGTDNVFCAGANIHMLGMSTHAWKVNFCKFTNETRCEMEDATAFSDQIYIAAANGTCAGGGYELALACKEIYLQDDGNSAVSLPEVPLLGVLPGTGGLTRLVDKRRVRRDRADVFSTTAEGMRGKRAKDWNLVDGVFARSKFEKEVMKRAETIAAAPVALLSGERRGVTLGPITPELAAHARIYRHVELSWDPEARTAQILVRGPSAADVALVSAGAEAIHAAGDQLWALRAFRELDDALLQLRTNHLDIGLVLLRTAGDPADVLAHDAALAGARQHWFVNEVLRHMGRVLRRLDLTSRSFFALGDLTAGRTPAFAGCLLELALAADRFYLLDEPAVKVGLSTLNDGALPMSHGLSRLAARLYGEPAKFEALAGQRGLMDAESADDAGLVTVRLDAIDWSDDTRMAIEERSSLSPDALTGMEANLRFVGHENETSKIFARLTAWQNWIFIRPNATGPEGALSLYGKPQRPHFDWNRV